MYAPEPFSKAAASVPLAEVSLPERRRLWVMHPRIIRLHPHIGLHLSENIGLYEAHPAPDLTSRTAAGIPLTEAPSSSGSEERRAARPSATTISWAPAITLLYEVKRAPRSMLSSFDPSRAVSAPLAEVSQSTLQTQQTPRRATPKQVR